MALRLSLLATSCIWLVATASAHGLACEASGYCSQGRVTPWTGDILKADALHAALAARSYRKEIIVSSTNADQLLLTAHLHSEALALGFAHLLFVSIREQDCRAVMRALPDAGCAWDSTENHRFGFDELPLLWNARWKLTLRAARVGYNVLTLDLDVLLFSDPYVHFKQPPFADVTLSANMEPFCGLNGGFMYVQNAAADGPATWLLKEVIERPLLLLDDDLATLRTWSNSEWVHSKDARICLTFDQAWLNDCFHSTLSPAPSYTSLIDACGNATLRDRPRPDRSLPGWDCKDMAKLHFRGVDMRQLPHQALRNAWFRVAMRIPPTSERDFHMQHFGFSLLPPARGRWSAALWRQLLDDCPACTLWRGTRDVNNATGGSAANAAAAAAGSGGGGQDVGSGRDIGETFAYVPQWLFSNFDQTGGDGYWSAPPPGAGGSEHGPLQVMGHVHCIAGAPRDVGSKYGLAQMYHPTRNYSAMAELRSGRSLYLTKQPVERVLALDPSLDLGGVLRSIHEYHRVVAGLIQLATLSDRIVAWPTVACNRTWLLSEKHLQAHPDALPPLGLPLHLRFGILPFADPAFAPHYACFTTVLFGDDCSRGNGLLPPEFRHWRDTKGTEAVAPRPANTVLLPDDALRRQLTEAVVTAAQPPRAAGQAGQGGAPNAHIASLAVDDAKAALDAVKDEAIVYVGYPVVVENYHSDEKFKRRAEGCQGLHEHWSYHESLMAVGVPGMPRVVLAADKRTVGVRAT